MKQSTWLWIVIVEDKREGGGDPIQNQNTVQFIEMQRAQWNTEKFSEIRYILAKYMAMNGDRGTIEGKGEDAIQSAAIYNAVQFIKIQKSSVPIL